MYICKFMEIKCIRIFIDTKSLLVNIDSAKKVHIYIHRYKLHMHIHGCKQYTCLFINTKSAYILMHMNRILWSAFNKNKSHLRFVLEAKSLFLIWPGNWEVVPVGCSSQLFRIRRKEERDRKTTQTGTLAASSSRPITIISSSGLSCSSRGGGRERDWWLGIVRYPGHRRDGFVYGLRNEF